MTEIPEDNQCVACANFMTLSKNRKNWYCPFCEILYPRVSKAKWLRRSGKPLGKWLPTVAGDVDEIKSEQGILVKALHLMKDKIPTLVIEHKLSDKHGVFGYLTNRGIVVAKSYIYGYILSCHTRALYSALNFRKPLIMYIEQSKRFYSFSPREVLEDGDSFRNIRGDAEMVNFTVKIGKRYII